MKDFKLVFSDAKSWIDRQFMKMSELMVVLVTFLLSALFLAIMIFSRVGRTLTIVVGCCCVLVVWLYLAYKFYNYAITLSKDGGRHRINVDYEDVVNDDIPPVDDSPDTYQLSFDDYLSQNENDKDEGE